MFSLSQLNIQMTPAFEKALARWMRLKGARTKSEAVRLAVEEGLERSLRSRRTADFHAWIGIGLGKLPNPTPRFASDDDLWERRDR